MFSLTTMPTRDLQHLFDRLDALAGQQAQAAAVALQTILDEYLGFIAQGQDL